MNSLNTKNIKGFFYNLAKSGYSKRSVLVAIAIASVLIAICVAATVSSVGKFYEKQAAPHPVSLNVQPSMFSAYAVYDDGTQSNQEPSLTFKFDAQKTKYQFKQDEGITCYAVNPAEGAGSQDWYTDKVKNSVKKVNFANEYKAPNGVTTLDGWFKDFAALTSFEGSNLNTSEVTSFRSLFEGCKNLENVYLGGWDTAKVEHIDSMFRACDKLKELDITSFDFSKQDSNQITCDYAFSQNAGNVLKTIKVGDGWDKAKLASSSTLFAGCNNLLGGNGFSAISAASADLTYAVSDSLDTPGYLTYGGKNAVSLSYDLAGGVGDQYTNYVQTIEKGKSFTVQGATALDVPTKADHYFSHWSDSNPATKTSVIRTGQAISTDENSSSMQLSGYYINNNLQINILDVPQNVFINDDAKLNLSFTTDGPSADDVAWTSSRPDVLTVDENGNIHAVNGGETTLTAAYKKDSVFAKSSPKSVNVYVDMLNYSFNENDFTASVSGFSGSADRANFDKSFTSVVVPDTITRFDQSFKVTKIDENAFKDNTKITSVSISYGQMIIGNNAFEGCTNLNTFVVKQVAEADATIYGTNVFKGCGNPVRKLVLAGGNSTTALDIAAAGIASPDLAAKYAYTPVDTWQGYIYGESGRYYCLQKDVNITPDDSYDIHKYYWRVPLNSNVVFDLNGYQLISQAFAEYPTRCVDEGCAIVQDDGDNSTLTILDSTVSGAGQVTGGNCTYSGAGLFVGLGNTLNLYSGNISHNRLANTKNMYGAGVFLSGTMNYFGGKVLANDIGIKDPKAGGIYKADGSTLNIVNIPDTDYVWENRPPQLLENAVSMFVAPVILFFQNLFTS